MKSQLCDENKLPQYQVTVYDCYLELLPTLQTPLALDGATSSFIYNLKRIPIKTMNFSLTITSRVVSLGKWIRYENWGESGYLKQLYQIVEGICSTSSEN